MRLPLLQRRRAFHRAVLLAAALGAAAAAAPWAVSASPRPAPAAGPTLRDTLRLSLDEAVARALAQGEEMRAAQGFVVQTAGQVRQEMSRALPQIDGAITYNRKLESIFSAASGDTVFGPLLANSPFAAEHTWTADFTASQLLWSGGKVGSALRAARWANRSARASQRETANEVTYQVRQAYYDAALAGRLVEIAEASLRQARTHLEQVRLFHREGSRAEYDLLRAEVDAANQEPPVIAARNGRDVALLLLKRLLNVPPDQPLVLATPLGFPDDLVPVAQEAAASSADRPALAAADAEVEARRYAMNVYKGQRWPDLRLVSTLSHQAFPLDQWPARREFRRNWDAGLRLEFPIFTGLRIEGQVAQARGEWLRAQASRDQLREAAAIELHQARLELDRSLSALLARRETVRQAERAWELAGVRYQSGMSPQIEVSDARLQLQAAEVNEVQATRDYLVALAQLERAVGRPLHLSHEPIETVFRNLTPEGRP